MIYFLLLLHAVSSAAYTVHLPSENDEICNTDECSEVADDFRKSMDESVDPCHNFYDFACGNWINHNNYPEYGSVNDGLQKLTMIARSRLREELETESSEEEILPVQKMKNLYKSCMKMTKSEGIDSINNILGELKGWPMIMKTDAWNSDSITWQEIDRFYEEVMGFNAFYKVEKANMPDEYGALKFSIQENLLNYVPTIRWFASELIKYNGAEIDETKLDREIEELKNFAEELDEIPEIEPFSTYFENVPEFMEWWKSHVESTDSENSIYWDAIFERLLSISNIPMIRHTPLWLLNVNKFKQLPKILESTEKRVIVNYVHAQFMLHKSSIFREGSLISFSDSEAQRWTECLHEKEPAVAHLFVKKHYGDHVRGAAENIGKNIHESFKHLITRSNWLSVEEKRNARRVVNQLKYILGHEDWFNNEIDLIDYYKHLTIDENYAENIYRLKKHEWETNIKYWGRPIKDGQWLNSVVEAGGEANCQFHAINIPAATLSSPLLAESIPHYVGYGTLGFAIAHEIGHHFDNGPNSFFAFQMADPDSIFTESAQCFIDEFDSYVGGSGALTLGDNLADWYGLQAALLAYKELSEKEAPNGEMKLPGFEKYTDLQMFFLSFSQFWCGGNGYSWNQNDEHAAHAYRVIGTLSNTKAFAETFKCSNKSPMNPKMKCNVWKKKSDKQ